MAINRRKFIKVFGNTAAGKVILGPIAGSLLSQTSNAQNAAPAKFIAFITPIGHHENWMPKDTPTGRGAPIGELGDLAQSLNPYKQRLTYIRNMWSVLKHFGNDGAHRAGYPASTTGHINKALDPSPALGPSIDQHLINGWNAQGQSLHVNPGGIGNAKSFVSWKGANRPINPSRNPRLLFDATFKNLSNNGNSAEMNAIRERGNSLLDVWTEEIAALKSSLSADHRSALDAHLTQLNELEKNINRTIDDGCKKPSTINSDQFYRDTANNYPVIGRHFIDIIASAFSCGLHRTATIAWNSAGGNIRHKWISGINEGHHSISHAADRVASRLQLAKIDQWYTEQFAYLLKKLTELNTGESKLLDSTLIYWGTETGDVRSHSGGGMRLLLAGNYNNYFKNGVYLGKQGLPVNNLLAEIATGLGVPTEKFGNPEFATGPLYDLRA